MAVKFDDVARGHEVAVGDQGGEFRMDGAAIVFFDQPAVFAYGQDRQRLSAWSHRQGTKALSDSSRCARP